MALSYPVTSFRDMLYLAATFDRAFPAEFVVHQAVTVRVPSIASVSSARGMERLVLDRVRRYGWSCPELASLRAVSHLSEMLASTDGHLRNIADHVTEGRPLRKAERRELFGPVEEMGHVLMVAGEACETMVRDPVTTLARRLIYLGKNARRRRSEFPPVRVLNRVMSSLDEIAEILHLAPSMV